MHKGVANRDPEGVHRIRKGRVGMNEVGKNIDC